MDVDDKLVVAVLAGTSREGRLSINAARYVADFARQLPNVEVLFADPAEFNFPHDGDNDDTRDPRYSELTARADAFYIVTPEYNHSIPGSLKRMLDSEYDNYYHKPVGLSGASSGPWGGVRVCEALLHVVHTMGMPIIKTELYFPHVQDLFDESGALKPEHQERYQANLQKAFDELLLFARLFKSARQ